DHELWPAFGKFSTGPAEIAKLGGDDRAGAPPLESLTEKLLVVAFAVGIRRVEKRDALIQRFVDQRDAGRIVGVAINAGKRHAAKPDSRNANSAFAELALGQSVGHHNLLVTNYGVTIARRRRCANRPASGLASTARCLSRRSFARHRAGRQRVAEVRHLPRRGPPDPIALGMLDAVLERLSQ